MRLMSQGPLLGSCVFFGGTDVGGDGVSDGFLIGVGGEFGEEVLGCWGERGKDDFFVILRNRGLDAAFFI